jgi:PAS domain S-box-containing protein
VRDTLTGSRGSIVLVDDSEQVRAILRRILVSAGFEVVGEGADGDEAILLAHRLQPSLLLLDTSMPRVDGIEALPVIIAVSPDTKVVMFTGFEEPGLAARSRELGAADFVEKSIRLEELPMRLARTLGPAEVEARTGQELPHLWAVPRVAREASRPDDPSEEEQAFLSQHVQQFRELFDRAEIGMATLTSNGTIVRSNRALAAMMSCRPGDLVGIDYGVLTLGRGEELDRRLEDIYALGADLTSFEHDLPAPSGEESSRTVRVTVAPVRDSNREVLYVFAQVQDVTAQRSVESDLRRSEEYFRRLVTAVIEYAIYMLDVDGRVASWNSGAERIKGYSAHEIVGRPFRVFYPIEDQATGHPEHNLEVALRDGSYAEEGWRIRKDGTRFWANVVITPVYDETGLHVGFAKITRDQTQQREHQEERGRSLEQRSRLMAVTAHELRTPATVIDGAAGALQASWHRLSDEERTGLLGTVRSSVVRLRRLASDLATASQLESEMLPLRLELVSVAEAVHSARTRSLTRDPSVTIEVDLRADSMVEADPERLAQALDNLLDNAARHGAPPIRVTADASSGVRIRVADAGVGVPEELLPHLFERFAIAGPSGGSGLGLYLVREIAREHGGDATYGASTETDRAAAFEITLPQRS